MRLWGRARLQTGRRVCKPGCGLPPGGSPSPSPLPGRRGQARVGPGAAGGLPLRTGGKRPTQATPPPLPRRRHAQQRPTQAGEGARAAPAQGPQISTRRKEGPVGVAAQGKKRFTWPRLVRGRLTDPRPPASRRQRRGHRPLPRGTCPRGSPFQAPSSLAAPTESTEGGYIGLVSDWDASTRLSLTPPARDLDASALTGEPYSQGLSGDRAGPQDPSAPPSLSGGMSPQGPHWRWQEGTGRRPRGGRAPPPGPVGEKPICAAAALWGWGPGLRPGGAVRVCLLPGAGARLVWWFRVCRGSDGWGTPVPLFPVKGNSELEVTTRRVPGP